VGTGRFNGADPLGIKTSDPADSTTWNRYAYVQGDPINHLDVRGLYSSVTLDGIDVTDYGGLGCDDGTMQFVPAGLPSCYGPVGPPPPPKPKQPKPDCMLKVEIRKTEKVPGATHASVVVTDAQGNTFTMQGFPDYSYFPFGNLDVQNTAGDIHDTQWGPTLTSSMIPDLCDRIADIERGEAYYASHEVRYGYVTSNTLAHWLLENGNVDVDQYYSAPPGSVGWDRNLYGNLF
jgi:hypothetical protein